MTYLSEWYELVYQGVARFYEYLSPQLTELAGRAFWLGVALWLFSTLIRLVVYSEARTKTATNIHWSSYCVGLSLVFGLVAFIIAALFLVLSQFIATLILLSILARYPLSKVFIAK